MYLRVAETYPCFAYLLHAKARSVLLPEFRRRRDKEDECFRGLELASCWHVEIVIELVGFIVDDIGMNDPVLRCPFFDESSSLKGFWSLVASARQPEEVARG